jgi:dTDP-4-amino-4,6-dideoxygalactose transaminase
VDTKKADAVIPFQDLKRQFHDIQSEVEEAIQGVLESGSYILGDEVSLFEREFADYLGGEYAVGVGSGTDAIALTLLALGVGDGDEVITTPFTAVPTVMAIHLTGARPVFADIREGGYGLDAEQAARTVTARTKALVPVHLFGECIETDGLANVARDAGAYLVEDACQAHGARRGEKAAGMSGSAGCFSFYPTKNLGAYGDAGAVATDDEELTARVRALRDYGRSSREVFREVGRNSRLDELQAAVLRVKLRHLDQWNKRRRRLAALYNSLLEDLPLELPIEQPAGSHVYHLFVIGAQDRDGLAEALTGKDIQTHVHYPTPVHLQPALEFLGYSKGDFPRAEAAAGRVLSLPMHPRLEEADVETVAREVRAFYR